MNIRILLLLLSCLPWLPASYAQSTDDKKPFKQWLAKVDAQAVKNNVEVAVFRKGDGYVARQFVDVKGEAISEGDLYLGPTELVRLQQKRIRNPSLALALATAPNEGTRWPNGVIGFEFHDNITAEDRTVITDAMATYERLTPLRFRSRATGNRVRFQRHLLGEHGGSYSSSIGMSGGRQKIVFRPFDSGNGPVVQRRTALHELGHALGLEHEHNRPDRDEHILVEKHCKLTTSWLTLLGNYSIEDDASMIGSYDFDSIMHYPSICKSEESQLTSIGSTNEGSFVDVCCNVMKRPVAPEVSLTKILPRQELSTGDINGLWLMYSSSPEQNEIGDQFGHRMLTYDFDQDGFEDVAVGVPGERRNGSSHTGSVVLYKGTETRLVYWKTIRPPAGEGTIREFGWAMAAGDFTPGGHQELAIAAPGSGTGGRMGIGKVFVYDVLKNKAVELKQTLSSQTGEQQDRFGHALLAYPDPVEGTRLVIGVPGHRVGKPRTGAVFVYDLSDEPRFDPVYPGSYSLAAFGGFGSTLASGQDVSARPTGRRLFASASLGRPVSGENPYTASNPPPAVYEIDFNTTESRFELVSRILPPNTTLSAEAPSFGVGDLRRIGRARAEESEADRLRRKFEGRRTVELSPELAAARDAARYLAQNRDIWNGLPATFAEQLAAGDFDGDGNLDIAISSTLGGTPRLHVFERNGAAYSLRQTRTLEDTILREDGTLGGHMLVGDLDGDEKDDLLMGLPASSAPGMPASGQVLVFSGGSGRSTIVDGRSVELREIDRGDLSLDPIRRVQRSWRMVSAPRELLETPITNPLVQCSQSTAQNQFGSGLAFGDTDGDGEQELFVGAPGRTLCLGDASGLVERFDIDGGNFHSRTFIHQEYQSPFIDE